MEVVRRGYNAWNRQDLDAVLECLDPDVVCDFPEGGLTTGTHRGHAGVRMLMENYFDAFETFRLEPQRLVESGDRIVALNRTSGRGRGSGAEVELHPGHVWTLREGKGVRLQIFTDWDEALEAVGLSE